MESEDLSRNASLMLRWAATIPLCTAASISFQERRSIPLTPAFWLKNTQVSPSHYIHPAARLS